MHGMAHALLVAGQIVAQDADRLESVAHLEGDDPVAQILLPDLLEEILRTLDLLAAHLLREAGHAACKDNALELVILRQTSALVIEALADAQAPKARIDHHLHAIEHVAFLVVTGGVAVAGDRHPVMWLQGGLLVDQEGRSETDEGVVVDGDELPFRKVLDLPAQLRLGVGLHVGIGAFSQGLDRAHILEHRLPDFEPGLRILRLFRLCARGCLRHLSDRPSCGISAAASHRSLFNAQA